MDWWQDFAKPGKPSRKVPAEKFGKKPVFVSANLRYCGSQPWPYPSVLMVGFSAEYESGELLLQRSELRKGQWFRRNALPRIPGTVSLARQLIDRWLDQTL